MDQMKIGSFIAECRKKQNLTQARLAEMLNITDRAVSKWERGKSLPDSSLMLELCGILKITVNDLLKGEVVSVDNYSKEAEKKLLEMVKEKEESDRKLLAVEWIVGILSLIIILAPALAAGFLPVEERYRAPVALSGLIPGFIGLLAAVKIEQVAGYYECRECGHRYVPTYRAVNSAMHLGRTRYMKCPECGKWSWQKKVIGKEG